MLLAEQKLIEVKDINDVTTSVADITGNPHGYKFLELDAATIPRSMPDVTVAVINANYALPAGLNPMTDSLMVEGAASPYINIFVPKRKMPTTRALSSCKKFTSPPKLKNSLATTLKAPLPSAGNKILKIKSVPCGRFLFEVKHETYFAFISFTYNYPVLYARRLCGKLR